MFMRLPPNLLSTSKRKPFPHTVKEMTRSPRQKVEDVNNNGYLAVIVVYDKHLGSMGTVHEGRNLR